MLEENPNYYAFLSSIPEQKNCKSIRQINKDINRTFPHDLSFSRPQLRNILVAYSQRNPNVGYCQSLNFIVATLLVQGFTEEESFWLLVQIIETYLPLEYYTSASGIILDQKIFDCLFRTKLGKLSKALERLGIESGLFTLQWLCCMFSLTFKREVLVFVWDHIFFLGHQAIFQVGIAAMWVIRKKLLQQTEFVQALTFIEEACSSLIEIAQLKSAMKERKLKVSPELLLKLHGLLEKEVISEFNDRFLVFIPQEQLFSTLNQKCIDDNECKQKVLKTSGFFTFSASIVNEIEGYLDICSYPSRFNYGINQEYSENYLTGKKNHCCRLDEDYHNRNNEYYEVEFQEDDEPIEFIRRNTAMTSVKYSFAYISSIVKTNSSNSPSLSPL